ncbi:MAG: class I SAM-dependent rRNA methyltransferase [Candidatus Magasanikbacteria bacterium]|nr:class I SAM-dependent rRNA methyltransferase [Candidatus Magasanikbacteria bacterium]
MTKLTVHKQRIGPILGRHPWVFSGALKFIPEGLKSGDPVMLLNEEGGFLAQGYFNSYSQIAVRLWSWDEQEAVDDKFFEKRISQAYQIRKNFVESKKTDSYRLIYSENDLLPGLIVDKYADCLVLQFHTPGIEFWKDKIVKALVKIVKPDGIYERSDVRDRKRFTNVIPTEVEGSLNLNERGSLVEPQNDRQIDRGGVLYGKVPERIKISENGYKFWVDVIGGQKTGFFLDQRDKRQALTRYVDKKSVLNCFSYSGGFSVYALGAGAKHVVSVDASESALELAVENVKLNKMDVKKCEFVCADVKQYLFNAQEERKKFDVIILDPPAFVKDRHKVKEGLMGYKKINEMALRALDSEGILVSASCSAHVTLSDFRYMLSESAGRSRRTLQVLETYTHGIDHPELVSFTEGEYLKCVFAKVV